MISKLDQAAGGGFKHRLRGCAYAQPFASRLQMLVHRMLGQFQDLANLPARFTGANPFQAFELALGQNRAIWRKSG